MHEEVLRGPLGALRARAAEGLKGEVTLVIGGTGLAPGASVAVDPEEASALARELLDEGLSPRDASRRLATLTTLSKKEAYALVLAAAEASS